MPLWKENIFVIWHALIAAYCPVKFIQRRSMLKITSWAAENGVHLGMEVAEAARMKREP